MKAIPIVPGSKFGMLTLVKEASRDPGTGKRQAECRCDCGKTTIAKLAHIRSGNTQSCGCRKASNGSRRATDLTGRRFGRWTALAVDPDSIGTGVRRFLARCDCGTERTLASSSLTSGHTLSCGCAHAGALSERSTTHGMHGHSLYRTWMGMFQRCDNPNNPTYRYYGGRGVAVCDRWRGADGFPNFVADMGDKPDTPEAWGSSRPYWTLDRIDVDGPYAPENCRWADPRTQAMNTQRAKEQE